MHPTDPVTRCRLDFEQVADEMFDAAWADFRDRAQPFRFELDHLREPSEARKSKRRHRR